MTSKTTNPTPPLIHRVVKGATVGGLVFGITPARWIQNWSQWLYPSPGGPDLVKTYDVRTTLPVRIFFPTKYDKTSPQLLPVVFTIHGGGFVVGDPIDDDKWNRRFADMHNFLVVALNYHKAPWQVFPAHTKDVEALMLAVWADQSLPINKNCAAIAGFSAGGNLTLSVAQLPSIRNTIKPSAVMPIYGVMDLSLHSSDRISRRYYKPALGPGPRGSSTDFLARLSPLFDWSYIPYGQDLRDPVLSPAFADRASLPPHIYMVGAELDQLGHESWRMACRWSGRPEPSPETKVGQEQPAPGKGHLILTDPRFSFRHVEPDGKTVQWLLIPDQIHGFDHAGERMVGAEGMQDAQLKTVECQQILGDWLRKVVWKNTPLPSAAS